MMRRFMLYFFLVLMICLLLNSDSVGHFVGLVYVFFLIILIGLLIKLAHLFIYIFQQKQQQKNLQSY